MKKQIASLKHFLALSALIFAGCQTAYYGTMEKFGIQKRDIMVDRVKDAKEAQQEAKEQFKDALEQFSSVVKFKGGDLEAQYKKLSSELEDSEAQAGKVNARIQAVEDVSDALFSEWKSEIKQYNNPKLKADSDAKLKETQRKYEQMIAAMKKASDRMEPALSPLRDQVLYLKHNLNAKAIGSLQDELVSVQTDVDRLVKDIESSIAEADKFISAMSDDS